jgi:hypothetical protein
MQFLDTESYEKIVECETRKELPFSTQLIAAAHQKPSVPFRKIADWVLADFQKNPNSGDDDEMDQNDDENNQIITFPHSQVLEVAKKKHKD